MEETEEEEKEEEEFLLLPHGRRRIAACRSFLSWKRTRFANIRL
jgi:uncharacterized membrane protein YidH (DUF202 family)